MEEGLVNKIFQFFAQKCTKEPQKYNIKVIFLQFKALILRGGKKIQPQKCKKLRRKNKKYKCSNADQLKKNQSQCLVKLS